MKRIVDVAVAAAALFLLLPLVPIVALGIRLSSRGPIFYRAPRVGLGGQPFQMWKFRTMHVSHRGAVITSARDRRVFPFGAVLRRLKLDEWPQVINVLAGQMAVVGPRPEDPRIVARAYAPWMRDTLAVRPGMTSPGALFYYADVEPTMAFDDPERVYIDCVLPVKLAIDRAYMERATMLTDLHCLGLTIASVLARAVGRRIGPPEIDVRRARRWTSDVASFSRRRAG